MNIDFQLCGLIITVTLLFFYLTSKRIKTYKQNMFLGFLLITIFSIILDICSVICLNNRDILSPIFISMVYKTFLNSVVFQNWAMLNYVIEDLNKEKRKKIFKNSLVTTILLNNLIYVLPVSINNINNILFFYGICISFAYFCVLGFFAFIIFYSLNNKINIEKRKTKAIFFWLGIWLVAIAAQYTNYTNSLISFASAISIMIIFIFLENPQIQRDDEFRCFNIKALNDYFKEMHDTLKAFSICYLSYTKHELTFEEKTANINLLSSIAGIKIFKIFDSNVIIICESSEDLRKSIDSFYDISRRRKNTKMPEMFFIETGNKFLSTEILINFAKYIKDKNVGYADGIYQNITEFDIEQFLNKDKISKEIELALQEDRVEVFYQPIFNIEKQQFTSAEALVRIRNLDGSLMSPGIFIPIAEDTGQIIELGDRVLSKTCDFIKNTNILDKGIEYIEINLSILQCENKETCKNILWTLHEYNVHPENINFEITETITINKKKRVLDNMNGIIKNGSTFSLDDFGKGESNINYIIDMPFNIIKLDMDITKAYHNNEKAKSMLKYIVDMAHSVNMKIVAEGIETKEELDSFVKIGVDYIQGYYFSRPIPQEEFLEFIKI